MPLRAEDKPNQFVWGEILNGLRVGARIEPASSEFVNFTLTIENSSTEEVAYITRRSADHSFALSEIDKNGKVLTLWISAAQGSPGTGPYEMKIKPEDAISVPVRVPWSVFDHRITQPTLLRFDLILRSTDGKPLRLQCPVDVDLETIRHAARLTK